MEYADKSKAAQSLAETPQREAATGNPVAVTGIHNSPRMVAQRRLLRSLFGDAIQLKEDGSNTSSVAPVQREAAAPEATNRTGLPDGLKAGIESLSGVSLDPVEVHYNSPQPAQLNALAYAQGTHIHVAPGQEQHLPHEAWHVVQQAQGRVQPTSQLAQGVSVNTDQALEQEADVMGTRALQMKHAGPIPAESTAHPSVQAPIQCIKILGNQGAIHINDYHFIDRLTLGRRPDSGMHAVILQPFDDFVGLAKAASDNPKSNFSFGGYLWGWRGGEELFPLPDDKSCVNLSADQIGELATAAAADEEVKDMVTLKGKGQKQVLTAFNAAKQQSPLPRELTLPIGTTRGALRGIPGIRFAEGKWWDRAMAEGGKPEAFLMGPGGSKEEGPHLHLFMSCGKKKADAAENDHPIVIESYVMTTSGKKHLIRTADGVVNKDKSPASEFSVKERGEVQEMEAMCDMINLAHVMPAAAEKVSSPKEEKKQQPGKNYVQESAQTASGVEHNIVTLAKILRIRPKLLGHFLLNIMQLDADSIENMAESQNVYVELAQFLLAEDIGYLGELDALAFKLEKSEDTVISLLVPGQYPSSEPRKYYDGLKGALKS